MGIYIKDMKAPASCCKCRFSRWSNYGQVYMCNVCEKPVAKLSTVYESTKPDWCPIVEVQELHGDLIDRDVLLSKVDDIGLGYYEVLGVTEDTIDNAPPVIKAKGSEENEKNNSKTIN